MTSLLSTPQTITTTSYSVGDIAYYYSDINIGTVASSTTGSISFDFPCYVSGSYTFTYYIAYANQSVGPSWITADGTNQQINYSTLSLTADTSYSFLLVSVWSTGILNREVSITVLKEVQNTVPNTASKEAENSNTVERVRTIASVTTSFSMGVVALATILSVLIHNASMQGIWSMIHQFQLYLLLPLLTFIPEEFEDFIEGFSFVLFNFDFIQFPSFLKYDELYDFLECGSYDSYLRSIGVRSRCAIANHIKLVLTLLIAL